MEAKFIVVQKITKALCRGLAAAQRKKFSVLCLIGSVLLLLGAALFIVDEISRAVFGLVIGAVLLLIGLFTVEINGAAMYNSMNPHVLADGVRYAFFDGRFETSSSIEWNRMSYTAILKIVETDEAFYLYITKASALSVDKAGFKVGSVDAFRAFLTEKTGLAVTRRRYKTCTKNKVIAIKPTDAGFEDEMIAVLNGDESEEDWDELTASIDDLSETVYEKCHIKTPVAIVNPENTDKALYMSYDGTSLYDVTDDNN